MKKEVLSPGKVLKDLIQTYQITASQLSRDLAVNISTLNALMNENGGRVSASLALKLSKYFGTAEDHWISLQTQYDLILAKKNAELTAILKGIKAVKEPKKGELKAKKDKAPKEPSKDKTTRTRRSTAEKTDKPVKEAKASKAKAIKAEVSKTSAEEPKKRGRKPKTDQAPKKTIKAKAPKNSAEAPKKRGPKPKSGQTLNESHKEAKATPPRGSTAEKKPIPIKEFDFSIVSSMKEKPRTEPRQRPQNESIHEADAVAESPVPIEEKPYAILIKRNGNPPIEDNHDSPIGESDASNDIADDPMHEVIEESDTFETHNVPNNSTNNDSDDDFDEIDLELDTEQSDSKEDEEGGGKY
jgi:addiction module HigA family antidote